MPGAMITDSYQLTTSLLYSSVLAVCVLALQGGPREGGSFLDRRVCVPVDKWDDVRGALPKSQDQSIQEWGTEEEDEGDPPRLWAQGGNYPGTAFTRSVGDSGAPRRAHLWRKLPTPPPVFTAGPKVNSGSDLMLLSVKNKYTHGPSGHRDF